MSKNVKLNKLDGKVIVNSTKIGTVKIGFESVSIFDSKSEKCMWDNSGTVTFGENVNIGQGVRISNHGMLFFSDGVTISANTSIICKEKIFLGKNSLITWDVLLMDNDAHEIYELGTTIACNKCAPIILHENVWIGCRCLILKGTTIKNGIVIAAGSLVTGRYEESCTVYATNKKILRKDVYWKK